MTYPIAGPLIGPVLPPQCPADASYALHPLFPHQASICEPVNLKRIPIGGQTQYAGPLQKLIKQIYQSAPTFANYFDFVFAYLENLHIAIHPEEAKRTLSSAAQGRSASYSSLTQTLEFFTSNFVQEPHNLPHIIRHELRHAFWHAIQKYTFDIEPYSINCFNSSVKKQRDTVAKYIKLGDGRVAELKTLLFKEGSKTLSSKEHSRLAKLRKACTENADLYHTHVPLPVGDANDFPKKTESVINKFIVGETYEFPDAYPNLIGKVKIVSKDAKQKLIIGEFLDPLRRLVYTTEHAQGQMLRAYPKITHEFEREAFLYGDTPLPLIKEFYPELWQLTEKLIQQSMRYPHPSNIASPLTYNSINEFNLAGLKIFFSNEETLLSSAQGDSAKLLSQIKLIIQSPSTYPSISFDNLKFALTTLVRHSVEVKEANKLLAKIADAEGDSLTACRYYHRAFKQGADFTFDDYTSCLTNLLAANDWGNAKIICQKALAQYRQNFDKIPLSQTQSRYWFQKDYLDVLEDFRQKIHQLRRP